MILEKEYIKNYNKLLFIAKKHCQNIWQFEAEDLLQELYFKVIEVKTNVLNPINYLSRMLFSLISKMLNNLNKECPVETLYDIPIEKNNDEEVKDILVLDWIKTLSKQKQLIMSYIMQGCNLLSIPSYTGLSWNNVRTHYNKALIELSRQRRIYDLKTSC